MNKATLGFKLVNDREFPMDPRIFAGGPWIHMATIMRRNREYCMFRHARTGTVYLEILDAQHPGLFRKIEDDAEWADLWRFIDQRNLFAIDKEETKLKL